jgi:hypothetical protein
MPAADRHTYLADLVEVLKAHWPDSRTVHVVCHGHSVPAGYFATPLVDTFHAYPHLLHRGLKRRFPFAVLNVIVTAIGGEHSEAGAARFGREVLCHRPDVVCIDYALNDRRIGLVRAEAAWRKMVEDSLEGGIRVLLLTPTGDATQRPGANPEERRALQRHADLVRALASEYEVGLVDSLVAFERYLEAGGDLSDLLAWPNHPNEAGHALVARELLRWWPIAM